MSISSEIERIQAAKEMLKAKLNSKNDEEHQITNETLDEFGDFADSIPTGITPTGTIAITENGTVDVTNYASADVNVSGGTSVGPKDVNLYDFDGTLLASYTKPDFLQSESLPENPTHDGLVSMGWNYSLADAKTYLSTHDKLDIGQMYNTEDNKTRIYITLREGRLNPYCGFGLNGTVTIDWGDNTTPTVVTGTNLNTIVYTQHEYALPGDYIIEISGETQIRIAGVSNASSFITKNVSSPRENDVFRSSINKIELGNVVLGNHAFAYCYGLKNVLFSKNILSIPLYTFQNCYNLDNVILPNTITNLGSSLFSMNYSLKHIILPNSITSISDTCFGNCVSLTSIVIPNSITSFQSSAFNNCQALERIEISDRLASIASYIMSGCSSLRKLKIPSNLGTIQNYAFQNCYSLTEVYFPKKTLTFNNAAFSGCSGLKRLDFSEHEQIPTITSSTFSSIASDCKIIVPDDLYESWIAASYWSNLSSKIVKASEA